MKEVRLLPEALEELEAAAEWYESGLGNAFADAVEHHRGQSKAPMATPNPDPGGA